MMLTTLKKAAARAAAALLAAVMLMSPALTVSAAGETKNLPGQEVFNSSIGSDVRFILRSYDKTLRLEWSASSRPGLVGIKIRITNAGGAVVEEKNAGPGEGVYHFKNGVHGQRYTVRLTGVGSGGAVIFENEASALFLDYSKLPALPLVNITTDNDVEPTAREITPSDPGLFGKSITGNDYVSGTVTITGLGQGQITSGMKIRVRGNTSAIGTDKLPYKIKLNDKLDLLGRGAGYANKDWILLNTGYNLNTYMGDYIASVCGMEYVPQMRFVNVMLNGDWKGIYVLTEPVEEGSSRVKLDKSGYLFENDAYWWNEGGLYFRTSRQPYQMAYTFKYPDITGPNDPLCLQLKSYMQQAEDQIYQGTDRMFNYIDMDTFTGWILARDILGTSDGAGSNVYFYKYDFNAANPGSSLIKMGPLWDFDSNFLIMNNWSEQHYADYLYFRQLFKKGKFAAAYVRRFQQLYPGLEAGVISHLDQLVASQGAAIEESRQLDRARWSYGYPSLTQEAATLKAFFHQQITWMYAHLQDVINYSKQN